MVMACNNNFCTVDQAKTILSAICIYTSCHVKVPTAAVSARSALGFGLCREIQTKPRFHINFLCGGLGGREPPRKIAEN